MGDKPTKSFLTDTEKFRAYKYMEAHKKDLSGLTVRDMAGRMTGVVGREITVGNMRGLLAVVPIPTKKAISPDKKHTLTTAEVRCIIQAIQEIYEELELPQRSCLEAIKGRLPPIV
ncbi:MAG: hypothetical protein ACPKM1_15785 [Spirochaetaceae bacterium]